MTDNPQPTDAGRSSSLRRDRVRRAALTAVVGATIPFPYHVFAFRGTVLGSDRSLPEREVVEEVAMSVELVLEIGLMRVHAADEISFGIATSDGAAAVGAFIREVWMRDGLVAIGALGFDNTDLGMAIANLVEPEVNAWYPDDTEDNTGD